MCVHVNDIYSFNNLGKPNLEYEGQRGKKENSQQRNNYLLEHTNSASQAGWKGRVLATGRDGYGSVSVHLCFEVGYILNPWAVSPIIKNKTW